MPARLRSGCVAVRQLPIRHHLPTGAALGHSAITDGVESQNGSASWGIWGLRTNLRPLVLRVTSRHCLENIVIGRQYGRGDRRGAGGEPEANEDLSDGIGWIDRRKYAHGAAAASTNQNVHREYSSEELSPRIVPGPAFWFLIHMCGIFGRGLLFYPAAGMNGRGFGFGFRSDLRSKGSGGSQQPMVARVCRLRKRLPRRRPAVAQSDHPGGRAARMGEHQRLPARNASENERAVLPAIAVSGAAAHRQERTGAHSAAHVSGRARLAYWCDSGPARRHRPGALDCAHRHPPHADLLRQRRVRRDSHQCPSVSEFIRNPHDHRRDIGDCPST
jgi:hypothetical protein